MNVAVGGTNGWFPDGQGDKPWLNQAGNPMEDFIKNKNQWLPTWPENVEDRAMVVDYVKMWKHC
ncbi:gram-negative bacteria-binding protein, partial [Mycena leptocephala]